MTTEQSLDLSYQAGITVFDRTGEKLGAVRKVARGEEQLVVEKGWLFPAAFVIPLSAIHTRDAQGIYLKLSKEELTAFLAGCEKLRPLVNAACQREAERQRAVQAERGQQFHKHLEKVLVQEVREALVIRYEWNMANDQPQATFDLWVPTQLILEQATITQQEEADAWSVSLRSGASLVELVPSAAFQQALLVAIGRHWEAANRQENPQFFV
jgi:hypothetical protein